MNRLTIRRDHGIVMNEGYDFGIDPDDYDLVQKILARLAAYEDTDLDPKEVQLISNVLRAAGEEFNCRTEYVGDALVKFADYKKAEEESRLVVLPCKVGADIFILRGDVKNGWETLKPTNVQTVKFSLGCLDRNMKLKPFYYLTREEAEAALAKNMEDI